MQKQIKIISATTLLFLGSVAAVVGITPTISIQDLESYTRSNNFKLSCSALGGTSAQFSYKKDGGSFVNFGSVVNLTTDACEVQITDAQINEQTGYTFKVTLDGSTSDETYTFYDISGPSGVSGYYKEQTGTGKLKIHWKNPSDSDFSKVVIYRGETVDFSADNNHEIARVSGGAGADMTYDENQPDPSKTYFYAIRALDKAGNSSSLVGDGVTTTNPTTSVLGASSKPTGKVTQLPKEGSVLGTESSPTPTPVAASDEKPQSFGSPFVEKVNNLSTTKKALLGGGIALLVYALYLVFKKK